MLDLVGDVRPAPARVDFVEQRARWVLEPDRARLLRLEIIALEAGPALDRIMVPRSTGEVLIAVEVAVRQDVQSGPLFVADDHRQGVLKLLAKADVHHAGIERPGPHAHVEPPRAGPRAGDSAG